MIASRYTFEDKALESRCLTEKMTQTDRRDIPKVLPTRFYEEQQELRNKLLMFRLRHYHLINGDAGQGLDFGDIEPRLQQATQSFAALFSKVPELMERFKAFLDNYNRELIEERSESFDGMIVQALLKLHGEGRQEVSSKDIASRIMEDFGLEKVTPQTVGKHLKSLKIEMCRQSGTGSRFIKWDDELMAKIISRYTVMDKTAIRDKCDISDNNSKGESINITDTLSHAMATTPLSPISNVTNVTNVTDSDFDKKQDALNKVPVQQDRMISLQEIMESIKDQPVPKEVLIALHGMKCKVSEDIAKSDVNHFLQDSRIPLHVAPVQQTGHFKTKTTSQLSV